MLDFKPLDFKPLDLKPLDFKPLDAPGTALSRGLGIEPLRIGGLNLPDLKVSPLAFRLMQFGDLSI